MATDTQVDDQIDGPVLAEGVDEEPVESNRRMFIGRTYLIIAALSGIYALFHVAALNGWSISGLISTPASYQAQSQANAADQAFADLLGSLGAAGADFEGNSTRRLQALATEVQATADNGAAIAGFAEALTTANETAATLQNEARASKRAWAERLWFLPQFPLETWNFRIIHIAGALFLGFLLYSARAFPSDNDKPANPVMGLVALALGAAALVAGWTVIEFVRFLGSGEAVEMSGRTIWVSEPDGSDAINSFPAYQGIYNKEVYWFGLPLLLATFGGIIAGWMETRVRHDFNRTDLVLGLCGIVAASYLIMAYGTAARNSVGTPNVPIGVAFAATAGVALILELTRRVAGLALVIIAAVFLGYTFLAHVLPGILQVDQPYTWKRFFGHVYSDAGILGPTTAVSSTYIILFIIFAAFLQASKVGDYFVNFAFACAGRARGGPAKVAIFASGLMGMINGTSAGNVVATGSLTIPLMKKVGYRPTTAGAVEAAASTGGQIMPPIMGAGAFIMAEITGIPYQDIAIAAIIPAILYFVSIYFMVDFEAAKLGMRGMREDELPKLRDMARRVFLFLPIIILIAALFMGYSVIRAGTLATASAAVVSWFTPYRMGIRSVSKAFELAGVMSIQIIAVCACAGIIVGVISLTGVGARFSSVLLNIAEGLGGAGFIVSLFGENIALGFGEFMAMFFAMCIAILLGMGMPTTAAYAVAASVVAPGLIQQLGIPALTAHFFVFYFAVVSAITPPVALASYAAAGISGANPMATSVASFKIGISAFIVPFMFFYNSAILMEGTWFEVIRAGLTATFGVFLLSSGVQGWWVGTLAAGYIRVALIFVALCMIAGGWLSDVIGLGGAAALFLLARATGSQPQSGAA